MDNSTIKARRNFGVVIEVLFGGVEACPSRVSFSNFIPVEPLLFLKRMK